MLRPVMAIVRFLQRLRRSPTQCVPPERDGNYDKPESVQPQEETLMSTLQFGINILLVLYIEISNRY